MNLRMVTVGASLGGLDALAVLLAGLDPDWPAAYAIVQHRRADNSAGLVGLLQKSSACPVIEPDDKRSIAHGEVYLAPGGYHLLVDKGSLSLSVDEIVASARPSIDVLFESAAESYGSDSIGVLLTASSHDGAAGLAAIAEAGGVTVVQDPETAVSPVAILAAMDQTRIDHVARVDQIPDLLKRLLN